MNSNTKQNFSDFMRLNDLRNAVRLLMCGAMFDDVLDVDDIPEFLNSCANDWQAEIDNQTHHE